MGTIRDALRTAKPHVSLSNAWRTLLQALRADKRSGGEPAHLSNRASIERFLDTPLAEGTSLDELKGHLSMLVRAESEVERTRIARLVDHQVTQLLPKERDSPVEVRIAGWPPGFSVRDQARFLADTGPLEALPPLTAARLIRDIDGVVVAGHRLCAQAVLNRGEILPSVPRAQRGRSRPQGQKSWLPHTDDVGRWSASRPEMTAQCIDAMADVSCVIDAFCGCGGDAVTFGRADMRVIAIELDGARASMATQNVDELGVSGLVQVEQGDANVRVPQLATTHAEAGLYLDPPWGGPGGIHDCQSWEQLIPHGVRECASSFRRVVLKAPRSFDVSTLPSDGEPWRVVYHFREAVRPPDTVVALLAIRDGSPG